MGIYPSHTFKDNRDGTVTETWQVPGLTKTRILSGEWTEVRTDCYCCSCGEHYSNDPYCRNHGFAGRRPCDVHNMPGQEDDEGNMPVSVQAHRANVSA
jgi:hypothetical protein